MLPVSGNSFPVALLGRRDQPTDALRDYCSWLAKALARRRILLETAEVAWDLEGFPKALLRLWRESKTWSGRWILVQYTALSWSRRGLPFGALTVLWLLRRRGARCAIVFHDARGFSGNRAIDRLRRACQEWTMRRAYRIAHQSIFTTPVESIAWLPKNPLRARFIPIGANIPERESQQEAVCHGTKLAKTVAVYGITGGEKIAREVRDIAHAVRHANNGNTPLNLIILGRNSTNAEGLLRRALEGANVSLTTLGLVPAEQITPMLSSADVLLFVRGPVANTRGSAIAGIACGLPIVGYAGSETDFPITEAGVKLVPEGDHEALAVTLGRVLSDNALQRELRQRSRLAYATYFSWDQIAKQYGMVLGNA